MATATLPKRGEIDQEYTWNLESMYGDNSLWEKDFELVGERLPGLEAYKNHLGDSPKTLLGALKMQDELGIKLEQLVNYANMRKDEDNTNSTYQALLDRSIGLWSQLAMASAFITPEILTMSDETLAQFL